MAKIFQVSARAAMAHVIEPIARRLIAWGVTPNAVTVAGTIGVVGAAVGLGATGHFVAGALVVTVFALVDLVDGTMARLSGGSTRFGALLDSTMDRIADGAIVGTVIYILAGRGDRWGVVGGIVCLVLGAVVSYVKARAEGLGMTANVGIAERAERLIIIGVGGLLAGFGLDWGFAAAVWFLAALSTITVGQRLAHVYKQAKQLDAADRAAAAKSAP
ncbi:phosphatidylinositol phosphate synthase [Asanoa sp. NPDC050611]|uniref:phosphatidylinositol phosphate synthase n=1 Tax=Asanoa sp. NPDC050611 TaxID=3157098 RepID=UPI0033E710D8